MPVKYVFVTGGVVSGLGKGITAASLGRLLKARGYKVTMQKFDPYINIDPGTMNPIQHGEVFVTDDGAETDLDLGHYERFIDESLTKNSNVTTGKIYWSVLHKERRGDFGGGTVQVIPHITNEIKSRFYRNYNENETHIAIIEVGGTVGDIESQPFLEAIRQFQHDVGRENAILIHVSLIPYLKASGEMKTKPTQTSVKQLQGMGIWPDILVCRSEHPLEDGLKEKIALFCNVPVSHVLQNLDVEYLYEAPLAMEEEHLAQVACECLNLPCPEPDLDDWKAMVEALRHPTKDVTVALVGKYIQLHDAYISVVEALKHGGIAEHATVHIKWIDSEQLNEGNVDEMLGDVSGILVPGGFGGRGIDGKIVAIHYARTHKIPFLGLCLGMQLAIVEYARNVAGLKDAHSIELDPGTSHPVIALMPDQEDIEDIGGTLRLGSYPCVLDKTTKAYELYGTDQIAERHRHRYEVNNDYRKILTDHGLTLSGLSPDGRIVEMIEIKDHPFFIATQAHPELKSRPNRPHPLFRGFVKASIEKN
ncbi:CTP synthase [uncultured Clostridium sp.]|uniref:CTP synthase n=1 Tax=Muricoprocola aceti TaxID=2981772 RepID=A0ABT2SKM5_9FIRM|nr:CTP synthase [Muricoprocola aceti]MCI7226012.1 CTP synthase [Lachnospiraceae bacterium]SCH36677.1 CTP synthase [uncultured Clostridium sp.]MCU6725051.1 CTP synthase [Muricoprocola aceti]MDD7434977.1 CTP synthase [Lachnospiraceae bacterium]MDY3343063.1 CTP synthase [Lachnospiraceae bacterium]